MTDVTKRDYLSHLPFELLAEIFEHAYKDQLPPKSPICRALLPLQQQALLRRVHIHSLSGLERFFEAYQANKGLGKAIRVLTIDGGNFERETGGVLINARRLGLLYSSLCNLEELVLGAASIAMLMRYVLAHRKPECRMPPLRRLTFYDPSQWDHALDPKSYQCLLEYPSLRYLEVTIHCRSMVIDNIGDAGLGHIRELVLKGDYVDQPTTQAFINNFPNLTSLTLDTLDKPPDFNKLVALLPTTLKSLTLHIFAWASYPCRAPQSCDAHLNRLVNLEYLYLCDGTFDDALLSTIRHLPNLRSLGFGPWAYMYWRRVEEILLEPPRLPKLERIILDQMAGEDKGRVGGQIRVDSNGLKLHPEHGNFRRWVKPAWRNDVGFSYLKVSDLVERVKSEGISVEGNVVVALKIQRLYNQRRHIARSHSK